MARMEKDHRGRRAATLAVLGLALVTARAARADEGMWPLDALPARQLQERYGFTPTPAWIEHLQKSCLNFGGGSGAFVSSDGLALTNHHVALNQLAKVSSPQHNYVHDGFFARTPAEELPCPDLELKVLQSSEDVTARVAKAVDPNAGDRQKNVQRKAEIARIEKAASEGTGLKGEVVELYHGGEYRLYRYKTYKDVRLVCAPEQQTAFFGGDPDNFSYPRHDLDFAFFRVYEDGRPVHPEHWLAWSAGGARDSELVFVAGNPGATHRLDTVAQLEYQRDCDLPLRLKLNEGRLAAYRAYEARGPEQARQARDRIFGLENNVKRQRGFIAVLRDSVTMPAKRAAEVELRRRVARDPRLARECGGSWERIAAAERVMRTRYRAWVARDLTRSTRFIELATGVTRYAAEVAKPNEQRLPEYRDSNLPSLRFRLLSRAPLYPELEEVAMRTIFQQCRDELGPDDAFVKATLEGRSPAEVAHALASGTKLTDPATRKALLEGGVQAVEASPDPLVAWARRTDPAFRELREWQNNAVESVETLEGGRIARARFALDGRSSPPDATGSLRLSFGRVLGYPQLSTEVPWKTTFHGLLDRTEGFGGRAPFDLAPRVAAHLRDLDLDTPLDFVCTDDIIGGNSGSPVVDRDGAYVGLVFDGNTQAFGWDFAYSDAQARCVAVHSRALLEALRRIYGMDALADELEGRKK